MVQKSCPQSQKIVMKNICNGHKNIVLNNDIDSYNLLLMQNNNSLFQI